MPAGHPSVDPGATAPSAAAEDDADQDGAPAGPHGGQDGSRGGIPGAFEPPPDTTEEDSALPAGTIEVETRDPDNKVISRAGITLGIVHQSVAKGESREHKAGVSDAQGRSRFEGLETGSGVAYRVTVPVDSATFAAMPFQLSASKGMRVVLHVYPVVHDLQRAVIVMQGILFVELKDDRVQIEQAVTIYNFGKSAWVPENVVMKLPEAFTAFNSQQQMGDQGVDAVDKVGVKLRGTFAPGKKDLDFRWQLPYSDEKDVDVTVGLPPHIAVMRVMAHASQDMKLVVEGFPDAQRQTDAQGQRLLLTERQMRRDDAPLTSVHIALHDLPAPGPGRFIAAGLAALGILLGFGFAYGSAGGPVPGPSGGSTARAALLAQLEELERARLADEIGPKTYDRLRRELIDALARTLVARSKA
jgi:hypothetical protein